jgi:hypothetical protein
LALRNNLKAKIPKTTLGNQTAIKGEMLDFSAKVPNTLSIKIKTKAMTIPMAKLIPIPPLRFMDETATAIMVNMNAETGKLNFL